ncbi:hypothetical protein EJ02DRAFT_332044, partial [Clathrospora elynae]
IEQQWKQHDTAARILNNLLATGIVLTNHDVQNEIQKLRLKELGGRSMVEAMLDFLDKHKEVEEDGT